jgi:hypothetical protein
VQWLVRLIPVTGAVEITHDLMTGRFSVRMMWELLYLVIAPLISLEITLRWMHRRLAG